MQSHPFRLVQVSPTVVHPWGQIEKDVWQAPLSTIEVDLVLTQEMSKPVFSFRILFILDGGKGRGRNIDVREQHPSVASRTHHDWGPNPQPSLCPDWIQPETFHFVGWHTTNWATPVRAKPVRIFRSLSEPNWQQMSGSRISTHWENAPENGGFAPYFIHYSQRRRCKESSWNSLVVE